MDFVNFRLMIAPAVVKYVIFWLGVLYFVVAAFQAMPHDFAKGLLILIVGPLLVRIGCELLLVLFSIHQELVKINKRAGDAGTPFVLYQPPQLSQIAQAFAPSPAPATAVSAAPPAEAAPLPAAPVPPPDQPAPPDPPASPA